MYTFIEGLKTKNFQYSNFEKERKMDHKFELL